MYIRKFFKFVTYDNKSYPIESLFYCLLINTSYIANF